MHAYILYITFTHLILYYIILYDTFSSILHLHFFCSSWQAGCPRLTTSDTANVVPKSFLIPSVRSLIHFPCSLTVRISSALSPIHILVSYWSNRSLFTVYCTVVGGVSLSFIRFQLVSHFLILNDSMRILPVFPYKIVAYFTILLHLG